MADQIQRNTAAILDGITLSVGEIAEATDDPNYFRIGTGSVPGGRKILTEAGVGAVGGGTTTFLGLTDTPGAFGTVGQVPVVNAGGTALEFVTLAGGGGSSTFIGLTDTPAGLGTAAQQLRMNAGATALEFFTPTPGATSFIGLSDTPGALGTAGQVVTVNAGGTALEFTTPGGGVSTFVGLSDTPGTITALRYLRGNTAGTALEYVPLSIIASLSDTPAAFGTVGQVLAVNAGATAMEFVTPASGVTTFIGLTDTPGSMGTAAQQVRVNAGGTALEFFTPTPELPAATNAGQIFLHNGTTVVASTVTALADGDVQSWNATSETYENKPALKTNLGATPYVKGTLLVGDGVDFIDFPVGADGLALTASSAQASGMAFLDLGDGTLGGLIDVQDHTTSGLATDQVLVMNAAADQWQTRDTKLLPFIASYSQTFVSGDWGIVSSVASLTIPFATHTKIVPVKVVLYTDDGLGGYTEVIPDVVNFSTTTSPDITIEIPAASVFNGKLLVL